MLLRENSNYTIICVCPNHFVKYIPNIHTSKILTQSIYDLRLCFEYNTDVHDPTTKPRFSCVTHTAYII